MSAFHQLVLPALGGGELPLSQYADRLLLVASDRVSAFDVVMNELVPFKGAVLTQITAWWLRQFERDLKLFAVDGVPKDFGADLLPEDFEAVAQQWERAIERVPALGSVGIKANTRGPFQMTPDELPLVGRVAAGSPIMSEENIDAHVRVDPAMFKPHADYLLKVRTSDIRSYRAVLGERISVLPTGSLISLSHDGYILLEGIRPGDLRASNFSFQ